MSQAASQFPLIRGRGPIPVQLQHVAVSNENAPGSSAPSEQITVSHVEGMALPMSHIEASGLEDLPSVGMKRRMSSASRSRKRRTAFMNALEGRQKSGVGPQLSFLEKLVKMLDDENPDIVSWTTDGEAFVICDQQRFAGEVLPKYFRSAKWNSFQRQLNLYNFYVHNKSFDRLVYANPLFRRGRMDLIRLIKRSPVKRKADTPSAVLINGNYVYTDSGESISTRPIEQSEYLEARHSYPRPSPESDKPEVFGDDEAVSALLGLLGNKDSEGAVKDETAPVPKHEPNPGIPQFAAALMYPQEARKLPQELKANLGHQVYTNVNQSMPNHQGLPAYLATQGAFPPARISTAKTASQPLLASSGLQLPLPSALASVSMGKLPQIPHPSSLPSSLPASFASSLVSNANASTAKTNHISFMPNQHVPVALRKKNPTVIPLSRPSPYLPQPPQVNVAGERRPDFNEAKSGTKLSTN